MFFIALLSVCLSVYLSLCMYVYLSVFLSVCLFFHLSPSFLLFLFLISMPTSYFAALLKWHLRSLQSISGNLQKPFSAVAIFLSLLLFCVCGFIVFFISFRFLFNYFIGFYFSSCFSFYSFIGLFSFLLLFFQVLHTDSSKTEAICQCCAHVWWLEFNFKKDLTNPIFCFFM